MPTDEPKKVVLLDEIANVAGHPTETGKAKSANAEAREMTRGGGVRGITIGTTTTTMTIDAEMSATGIEMMNEGEGMIGVKVGSERGV